VSDREAVRRRLGQLLVERALLRGRFVLRSGRTSDYYLDKYRFETDPELLEGLGRELAELIAGHAPQAELLAGPELGAVPLAAVASIQSRLPYVIVRKEAKEYGTANRIEGVFEPGARVCVVEDVVTSGGALLSAVDALADAGLEVCAAICVVDRQEGGAAAIAARGIPFRAMFTTADLGVGAAPEAANPA
jgi:orotate phosphoribosyltransferase